MSDEQKHLEAIKARLAKATSNRPSWVIERGAMEAPLIRIPLALSHDQRLFVAYAPDDIRWLLTRLEAIATQKDAPEKVAETAEATEAAEVTPRMAGKK